MIVDIKGKDLKRSFSDIAPLIKKSETSKSVAIGYNNGKLVITTDTGTQYQAELDIEGVIDAVDMSMTVWFEDISPFIGARDLVHITFSNFTVSIETDGFSTQLGASGAVINMLNVDTRNCRDMSNGRFAYAVQKLSLTTPVSKALQITRPIVFKGEYAYMEFPTVWLRCISSDVNSILSLEQAKTVINFQAQSLSETECLTFIRGNDYMVMPNNPAPNMDRFAETEKQLSEVVTLETTGLFSIIQKLYRIIGGANTKVYVYEHGIEFAIETPNANINKKIRVSGQLLETFEIPLEYLLMCFNIFGDDFVTLKRRDQLICLQNDSVSIILSVL